jgi:hypothetical protein
MNFYISWVTFGIISSGPNANDLVKLIIDRLIELLKQASGNITPTTNSNF